jgi:CysZ protein
LRVLIAGVVVAGMLSIPLVNWLTPVVAIAFMVHLFEGLRRKAGPEPR